MTESNSQSIVKGSKSMSNMTLSSPHNVPAETWDEIIQHLRHDDILFLSLTCRYLYAHITELQTWRRLLRRICKRYGWLLPTFPMSTMDLDHLRRVCRGPERWEGYVQKYGLEDQEIDLRTRYFYIGQNSRLDFPSEPQFRAAAASYMIPGGRFFLSCRLSVDSKSMNVVLWDLGVPGQPLLPAPTVVASTDLDTMPDRMYNKYQAKARISVYSSEDTLTIGIVLVLPSDFGDKNEKVSIEAHILSVAPANADPSFTKMAACHLLERDRHVGWMPDSMIHENRLLLAVRGMGFLIWDFKANVYGLVPVEHYGGLFSSYIAMFTGGAFVAVDGKRVGLWEVPALNTCMADYPECGTFLGDAESTQEPVSSHAPWKFRLLRRESHVNTNQHSTNFFFETSDHDIHCERYEVVVGLGSLVLDVKLRAKYDRPSSVPLERGRRGSLLQHLSGSLSQPGLGCQDTTMTLSFTDQTGMPASRQYAFSIQPEEGKELHRTTMVPLPCSITEYDEMEAGRDVRIMRLIDHCLGAGRCVFDNALPNHTVTVYDFFW